MNDSYERFTLTAEHVALLRAAYVCWEGSEAGAPSINPKRPYGNTSVERDIVKVLGWDVTPDDDGNWLDSSHRYIDGVVGRARAVHEETATALQVILATGSFEPGEYVAPKYTNRWRRASQAGGR